MQRPIILHLMMIIMMSYTSIQSQDLYIFLKIDGIPGEYTFPGNIPDGNDAVELKNFQFIEANSLNLTTIQSGGHSKIEPPELEFIVDPMDKAIIGLYEKMMSSVQASSEIRIYSFAQLSGNYYDIEVIKLKNPRVIEIITDGQANNSSGTRSIVKLKYEAIEKKGFNYILGTFTPAINPITISAFNYLTQVATY